jgi:EmrB/QacA subfamily drug resistance transporter
MKKRPIVIIIIAFVMFMDSIDTSILNTAIPSMAKSFHLNPIDLKLALISYLMSLAIFLPISGWIADRYGAKRSFMFGISLFTLSSLWCGFTDNLVHLIVGRFFQGLGGSLTTPIGRLILMRAFKKHEIVEKMSDVLLVASMGMIVGPVLGGFITSHFSYRWIFWINIPIGMLNIFLCYKFLPPDTRKQSHRLDKLGFVLFGLGLALSTFGMACITESQFNSAIIVTCLCSAALLFLLYIWHSYGKPHQIINIHLLEIRTFRIAMIGNLLYRFSFGGLPFILPMLLQVNLGFSPQLSGLLLVPLAIGAMLAKPLTVHLPHRFGYKRLLIVNSCMLGLSLSYFGFIHLATELSFIIFCTFTYGFFSSFQFSAMNSLAYANVPDEDMSSATSLMSTAQQVSQSFGVAIGAIMLHLFSHHLSLTIQTFQSTFFLMGSLSALSATLFLMLHREDGHELIEEDALVQ